MVMSTRHLPTIQSLARRRPGVAFAAFALALSTVVAQESAAPEGEPIEMEKMVVTGSLLPTVDAIGPSPVISLTREKIEETGLTTVSEILRRLPQQNGPSFDEKFQNSFAPGSSGISLRGLGQQNTLILLNGRRIAPYGFAQNINEVFIDLNSLPLAAVERVEVLKDGASALYGSDAVAGVVNIILRKEYDGTEISARIGNTTDNDALEQVYSIVTGISTEKSSALFVADYYSREAIFMGDRDYSSSADQSRRGGYDQRSGIGPNPARIYAVDGSLNAIGDGETGVYPGGNSWVSVNPDGSGFTPGVVNYFDFNPYSSLIPETTRYGFVGLISHDLADWAEVFAEASYRNVNTVTYMAPTPIAANSPPFYSGYPAGLAYMVPASNPYNPFGEDVYFRYRPTEAGQRINELDTDAVRFLVGPKFHLGAEWEAEAGFLYNNNKTISRGKNYIDAQALREALFETDPSRAFNVFAPYANYVSDTGQVMANNPEVLDRIRVNTFREGESELSLLDAKAYGPIVDNWAGTMAVFVGIEGRHERFSDTPDSLSATEQIVSSGGTAARGSRYAGALYGELSIPLASKDNNIPFIEAFDLQLALRWDNYEDFGNSVNPKVGAKWKPFSQLALRGSYATGFRAPSLPELYMGESVAYNYIYDPDPESPRYGAPTQYHVTLSGNEDLDAEESESFSVGAVWEPVKGLSLYVDYWWIKHEDAISSFSDQYIVEENFYSGGAAFAGWVIRDPVTHEILETFNSYENLATREVDGIDFGASWEIDTDIGTFTPAADFTYLNKWEDQPLGSGDTTDYAGTFYYPRWRGVGSLFWNYKRYTLGGVANYIGSYGQAYEADATRIDAWLTFDVQASVELPYDFKVTAGCLNVADDAPPFSDYDTEGYDIGTHDPRGRFWYVGVSKKF